MRTEIKNSSGKILYFETSLINYLQSRIKRKFVIGDWLETLSSDELNQLSELSENMEIGDKGATDHIVAVFVIAIAAELQQQEIKIAPDLIPAIGMLASFQKIARIGYVKLHKPLALTEELSFEITDLGQKAGVDMTKRWEQATYM